MRTRGAGVTEILTPPPPPVTSARPSLQSLRRRRSGSASPTSARAAAGAADRRDHRTADRDVRTEAPSSARFTCAANRGRSSGTTGRHRGPTVESPSRGRGHISAAGQTVGIACAGGQTAARDAAGTASRRCPISPPAAASARRSVRRPWSHLRRRSNRSPVACAGGQHRRHTRRWLLSPLRSSPPRRRPPHRQRPP